MTYELMTWELHATWLDLEPEVYQYQEHKPEDEHFDSHSSFDADDYEYQQSLYSK